MLDAGIADVIAGYRYRFVSEDELQRGIAAALRNAGFVPEREVRLARGDIIDLLVNGVGIEAKIAGSPQSIARQLMRYAASTRVRSLILVTRKSQHALRFPDTIGGKPLRVVTLETSSL